MKDNPADRFGAFRVSCGDKMPGDGLALTVRVSRENDLFCTLNQALELFDRFTLVTWNQVFRRKVAVYFHTECALGEVTYVTH